jgi:hypothetical protein
VPSVPQCWGPDRYTQGEAPVRTPLSGSPQLSCRRPLAAGACGGQSARHATLEAQRRALAAACRRRGWQPLEPAEQVRLSAQERKRPGIEEALPALEPGDAQALAAAKRARFRRRMRERRRGRSSAIRATAPSSACSMRQATSIVRGLRAYPRRTAKALRCSRSPPKRAQRAWRARCARPNTHLERDRRDRALNPRTLGRHGLHRRAREQRDPARLPHHRRLQRLHRHDHRPPLPRRPQPASGRSL